MTSLLSVLLWRIWFESALIREICGENLISVLQLGTLDYSTGLRLQEKLVGLRKDGRIGDALLLLEHTPVITLGRNAKSANILASPELLAQRGVEVFECDRGGDVTFHGPANWLRIQFLICADFRQRSPAAKRWARLNTFGAWKKF